MTKTAADGPARRSYPKGVRRRQQILDSVIALLAQRGVDRASLRTVGEAIGVSHTALRHYFSSRDELLVEAYRTHEARAAGDGPAADSSAVSVIIEAAERNRSIPGLVELYATLTTDALQEQHALTREFVRDRFRSLRGALAERIAEGQPGAVGADGAAGGRADKQDDGADKQWRGGAGKQGRGGAGIDPMDAAALVIAASDGLQIQWLLDPDAVDVGRSLAILDQLLPRTPRPDGI